MWNYIIFGNLEKHEKHVATGFAKGVSGLNSRI